MCTSVHSLCVAACVTTSNMRSQRPPPHRLRLAVQGHLECARVLATDSNIDVTQPLTIGASPFYVACQNGHLEVVKFLASDERVDITQGMSSGATPLYVACQNGHLEVRAQCGPACCRQAPHVIPSRLAGGEVPVFRPSHQRSRWHGGWRHAIFHRCRERPHWGAFVGVVGSIPQMAPNSCPLVVVVCVRACPGREVPGHNSWG